MKIGFKTLLALSFFWSLPATALAMEGDGSGEKGQSHVLLQRQ